MPQTLLLKRGVFDDAHARELSQLVNERVLRTIITDEQTGFDVLVAIKGQSAHEIAHVHPAAKPVFPADRGHAEADHVWTRDRYHAA